MPEKLLCTMSCHEFMKKKRYTPYSYEEGYIFFK